MNPMRVRLLSMTPNPAQLLYQVWEASRRDTCVPMEVILADSMKESKAQDVVKVFKEIVDMSIPIAEFVHFVFIIEHMSVAFREQMVRARQNSYWVQGMRILDLTELYDRRQFRIPDFVDGLQETGDPADQELYGDYLEFHKESQDLYCRLVHRGCSRESAREHLGLNTTHRCGISINMRSLVDMLSKRCCWIAQSELWHPFVRDVMGELRRVFGDEIATSMLHIPCLQGDTFTGCKYRFENKRRYEGSDPLPPCPLWQFRDQAGSQDLGGCLRDWEDRCKGKDPGLAADMWEKYHQLWGRDPMRGCRQGCASCTSPCTHPLIEDPHQSTRAIANIRS